MSLLQLLDQGLHVGRDYFFRGLLLLLVLAVDWLTAAAVVFMGASSLGCCTGLCP